MKKKLLFVYSLAIAFIIVLPVYWIFIGSFLSGTDYSFYFGIVPQKPAWFPLHPSIEQYKALLFPEAIPYRTFLQHFCVSLLSSLFISVLHMLVVPPLGFYLARQKNRFSNCLFFFVVLTMLAPLQVTMPPSLILSRQIGTFNTWWAIVLPMAVMPFGVFLMRQFFRALPGEMLEAALLDTNSFLQVFWHIVIPAFLPAFLSLFLIGFSEFYSMIEQPLILLDSLDHTMPLAVEMNNIYRLSRESVFAASVLFIAPCLILYSFIHKPLMKALEDFVL